MNSPVTLAHRPRSLSTRSEFKTTKMSPSVSKLVEQAKDRVSEMTPAEQKNFYSKERFKPAGATNRMH